MAKILIVDDSATIRTIVKKALEPGQFELKEAGDGVEALEQVKGFMADLVISDINMPNMDGLTMVENLRKIPQYASTPVIVLSTEASQEMKNRAKAAGVTAWMVKPPDSQKLFQAAEQILKMKKSS